MPKPTSRAARRRNLLLAVLFVAGLSGIPAAFAAAGHGGGKSQEAVGTLIAEHADDFARGKSAERYVLETEDGNVAVNVPHATAAPLLGKKVKAEKRADGTDALVLAEGGSTSTSTSTATAPTETTKRIAVILMNFSNDTRQPWTQAQVRATAFDNATSSVAAYYRQASWGGLTLTGDVFGWFTIPDTNTACNYNAWATSANAAAAAAGINLSTYNHVVYAFPSTSACSWSGLANMPGRNSWLNNAGTSLRVMAHELGHNFGTHHASTLSCTQNGTRVSLSATASSCTSSEYGDPFSVMGASSKYLPTNYSRGNFGWLQPANTQTATTAGDYLLKPISFYDATAVQALRVRRTSSTFFNLELRQPDGSYFDSFAASDPAVTGVTVRITSEYTTRTQSQLVDANPATTTFADAPLQPGQTIVDPLSGVSLTAVSVSAAGATVRVSFAPDSTAPTAPSALNATPLDSTRVSLSWGASSDNVGVAGYRVSRNGVLVATVTGTSYTDTGLAAGTTYDYSVVAFDAAGNTSPAATKSASTPAADTEAPTAPTNLTGSLGKGKKVTLSWSASTDNVGVAGYHVYRDGALAGTTTGTSFSETLGGKTPSATYHVVAFDAAGNVSPAASVTVR